MDSRLPNIFINNTRSRSQPTSPTLPQQRVGLEELKRAMIQSEPEAYRNDDLRFGHNKDIPVGTTWSSRDACAKARIHTSTTAGISGGKDGAYSIVMSGGYADDIDNGDVITYTGTGGYGNENRYGGGSSRAWGSSTQIEDQSWEHKDNNSLRVSFKLNKPVRVIRGYNLNSKYAPRSGYRYDGLYRVTKAYMDKSKDGVFQICRFELHREPGQGAIPTRWN